MPCPLSALPAFPKVAPNQFELAPIFKEANLAVDQNSLLMDVMRKVAERHDFVILFHEKPFAGVNGSGKHNNWSLVTDTGVNLLAPSKTPRWIPACAGMTTLSYDVKTNFQNHQQAV